MLKSSDYLTGGGSRPVLGRTLPTFGGLRFLAMILVFSAHIAMQGIFLANNVNHNLQLYLYRTGYGAVEFFFLLSGFVLTWSARPDDTPYTFWRRRLARLFPNNTLTCLIGAVLVVVTGGTLTAAAVLPNLFMVQTWVPKLEVIGGTNPVAWSMGCELFFYALFPFLLGRIRAIPDRLLWVTAAVLVAIIVAMPFISELLPPSSAIFPFQPPVSMHRFWFVYFFPPPRTLEFALGMVTARIVMTRQWPRVGMASAFALMVVGYVITVKAPHLYVTSAPMIVPLVALIGATATRDLAREPSPRTDRRLLWVGDISFSFYIIHYLVVDYTHRAFGLGHQWNAGGCAAFIVGTFVATLTAAVLLHYLVEKPGMRYLGPPRRRASRPAPVVAADNVAG